MNKIYTLLKSLNAWEEPQSSVGIERKAYLDTLVSYLDNRLVKVLIGQRRAAKSYLLKQLIAHLVNVKGINPKQT